MEKLEFNIEWKENGSDIIFLFFRIAGAGAVFVFDRNISLTEPVYMASMSDIGKEGIVRALEGKTLGHTLYGYTIPDLMAFITRREMPWDDKEQKNI